MKELDEDDQAVLIREGLRALRDAGARDVCAFRAGNYGADLATLRALATNGVRYDTSHNACYLGGACGLDTPSRLVQPRPLEGVWEFPISTFADWPGHVRHAQLCACSAGEMESAILRAAERGWYSFVVVSHSFELIRGRKHGTTPRPDRIVIRRFERLCAFLARNRDRLRTCGFADLDVASVPSRVDARPLPSRKRLTAGRYAEQMLRRLV
jgi:hypothetical protein